MSGLLLLSLGVLTVKTAFTLVTGNTFVYFVQPVFADVAVSAIFLGSLVRAARSSLGSLLSSIR